MSRTVKFFVPGKPATAGSINAIPFIEKRTGRLRVNRVADSASKAPWMALVALAARQAWSGPPTKAPVEMSIVFKLSRPNGHYGSGKNENIIKASAPYRHTQKPDTLKMARAVEDALTGIVYADDSQVWYQSHVKEWIDFVGEPGALVTIVVDDEKGGA